MERQFSFPKNSPEESSLKNALKRDEALCIAEEKIEAGTTKDNSKKIKSKMLALVDEFKGNERLIRDMMDNSKMWYVPDHQLVVDQDIHEKFLGMSEDAKKITQQERKIAYDVISLIEKNKIILSRLADIDNDNESSEFVLNRIKKDGEFFFDYWKECLEILKKGDIFEISRKIIRDVASGKIQRQEYFIYAYILTEITPEIKENDEVKRIEELFKSLEGPSGEIKMLSIMLKTAKEQGIKLTPENIRGMKIETREVGELSREEKEKFLAIYKKEIMVMVEDNYSKVFAGNPEAKEKVMRNFGERLSNLEKYRVHMLTFQKELVAVMTMHPEGENEVMAESFIVHPDAKHYSLGIAFAKEVMKQESACNAVNGKVRADNAAIIETHKKLGFEFDFDHPFKEFGVEYMKMRLRKGGFLEQ